MISFKNKNFVSAVDKRGDKTRSAILAGSSTRVLDKVLAGEKDLTLASIDRLAEYYGFDVQIVFVAKASKAEPALAA